MPSPTPLPPYRRIVTAHSPLPEEDRGRIDAETGEKLEAPVKILFDDDDAKGTGQIWWAATPASQHTDEDVAQTPPASLVVRGGSNCRSTTLAPGQVTSMHRTSSLDYNVVTHGTITLLTPLLPSVPSQWPPSSLLKTRPDLLETKVSAGEVVVQRGTIHAWRNDTDEFVRWTCVLTDAEAVSELPEVWVLEGDGTGKGEVRAGKGL
ncbi:hypothetical protein BDY24DRAFT_379568 [Mrakia frigida]|uniref:cupin domain-containing protein n=1 Tax=Mrakia frigida TaxID=29902 RepID=UPI003FCC17D2